MFIWIVILFGITTQHFQKHYIFYNFDTFYAHWSYAIRKYVLKNPSKIVFFFVCFVAKIMKFVSYHSGNNIRIFHKNISFSVFCVFFGKYIALFPLHS